MILIHQCACIVLYCKAYKLLIAFKPLDLSLEENFDLVEREDFLGNEGGTTSNEGDILVDSCSRE